MSAPPAATAPVQALWIVVPNWNGREDTTALLRSLADERAPAGWRIQVLVVDNGSTDGSVAALSGAFPDVELLALPENRRFAGGSNAGIAHALERGADAVMLLNNDTLVTPGLTAALLQALAQRPGAAAAPLILFADPPDRIWYGGGRCSVAWAHTSHRGMGARFTGQYRATETTGYLTGCCLVAPRAVWQRVGLLDERYFFYGEDADWSLRARAAGHPLLFVPAARIRHKVSASAGLDSPWKFDRALRANWMLFTTHARGLARLTWRPCFVARALRAVLLGVLVPRRRAMAVAIYRALWDSIRGRPAGISASVPPITQ